jgi:hypothetical protein
MGHPKGVATHVAQTNVNANTGSWLDSFSL